jgi:ribulose-phosphate 3-epimerase
LLDSANGSAWLQVDGGITANNIAAVAAAGADTFVAGSSVFGSADRNKAIELLRSAAQSNI